MKIGVVYPQTEMAGDPEAVRRFSAAAEEVGYDHMIVYDHVLGAVRADRRRPLMGPYDEKDSFHDPFTMLSYVAAKTTRLELVTGIVILPQRPTVLVAKQALDIALFADYRFRLGVGTGWNWVEYEALGQDFDTRGARLDEQVPLLRRLWTEELVTYEGSKERIDRAGLVFHPRQPIPIWMGGKSEPAFRRAARWGDGFIFMGSPAVDPRHWSSVSLHLEREGRSKAAFGRELLARNPGGRAEDIADALKRWRDEGHTHGSIVTMNHGLVGVDAHIEYAAKLRRMLN